MQNIVSKVLKITTSAILLRKYCHVVQFIVCGVLFDESKHLKQF